MYSRVAKRRPLTPSALRPTSWPTHSRCMSPRSCFTSPPSSRRDLSPTSLRPREQNSRPMNMSATRQHHGGRLLDRRCAQASLARIAYYNPGAQRRLPSGARPGSGTACTSARGVIAHSRLPNHLREWRLPTLPKTIAGLGLVPCTWLLNRPQSSMYPRRTECDLAPTGCSPRFAAGASMRHHAACRSDVYLQYAPGQQSGPSAFARAAVTRKCFC